MPPFLQLFVEIIQKDITQEGRKRPALRNTFGRCIQPALYDNTGPKILAYQSKNALVTDSPGNPVRQNIVVDHIEEFLKVDIHGIGISSLNELQHLLDGLMCRTARPEPETGFGEMRVKGRGENLTDRLLNNAIHDNGDTEITGAPIVLGNLDPLDRFGTVSPVHQRCLDSFPVLMGIIGKLLNRNTIDTRSP